MRYLSILALLLCAACSGTYVVPEEAVAIRVIAGNASSSRESVPKFPARLALVRVQSAKAHSQAGKDLEAGGLVVTAASPSLSAMQSQQITQWPAVDGAAVFDLASFSGTVDSMDSLRLEAAKLQVDVLLVCTVGTTLQADDRLFDAGILVPLQPKPKAATFSSHVSVSFVDVRTGFIYGSAQAVASAAVGDDWLAPASIDRRRLEAEQQAMTEVLQTARETWAGIVAQYR